MRHFKFRIWDNLKKQWCSNQAIWRLRTDIQGKGEIQAPAIYWGQDPSGLTIQQFTGLKDKKGNEIYEGDIIESFDDFYDGCVSEKFKVIWWEEECRFCFQIRGDTDGGHLWSEINKDCYVMGNILENPELIKP